VEAHSTVELRALGQGEEGVSTSSMRSRFLSFWDRY
jgi:hypothetical protein